MISLIMIFLKLFNQEPDKFTVTYNPNLIRPGLKGAS